MSKIYDYELWALGYFRPYSLSFSVFKRLHKSQRKPTKGIHWQERAVAYVVQAGPPSMFVLHSQSERKMGAVLFGLAASLVIPKEKGGFWCVSQE